MLKISGPVGALACSFLLSGVAASLSVDNARADACLAAPKIAAPSGQHWFYHIDRATKRKCWYLHGAGQVTHHIHVRHHETASEAAPAAVEPSPAPVPQPAASAEDPPAFPGPTPAPVAAVDNAPPAPAAPHVTVLSVKTVSAPFVGTTAGHQPNADGKPSAPGQPAALPTAAATQAKSDPVNVNAAEAASPHEAMTAARNEVAPATDTSARTKTAEMFFLLALGLGIAAILVAVAGRLVGASRMPRISYDPDAAWRDYQFARSQNAEADHSERELPFVESQGQHGIADLHKQAWLNETPPADASLDGIEPALRALRQARRHRAA